MYLVFLVENIMFIFCSSGIMITYINPNLTYEQLRQEMRGICRFPSDQIFTMKWVDEEGNQINLFIFKISISLNLYDSRLLIFYFMCVKCSNLF